jgi:TetR/AcrR family transcriptional regulator
MSIRRWIDLTIQRKSLLIARVTGVSERQAASSTTRRSTPRRAPTPEARRRDAERTRQALLDAALAEFSAKGRAGARVGDIAARAGVDKQLISYYFGGKDGLYRALFERWRRQEEEFSDPDVPLDELVVRYVADSVANRDLHRLLVRDCLDDDGGDDDGGTHAAAGEGADVTEMRRRQERGEIADDIDPAFLLLALTGAVSVGIVFPADVRAATGLDPSSPEFAEHYGDQLRRIVRRLAVPPTG